MPPIRRFETSALALLALICLPATLVGQTPSQIDGIPIIPSKGVRMTSCARADSLLGPVSDGLHPGIRATNLAPGVMQLSTQSGDRKRLEDPSFIFSLTALEGPHPAIPKGDVAILVNGPAGLAILKAGSAPSVRFELPDSIVLRPLQITLGRYEGPDQFASAPLTATLTPASVQAMALATRITVVADSLRMDVPYTTLTSLHDVFRTGLCGYGPKASPN